MIVGIDEVGRGAWAGPLVVGAVVLGNQEIPGLTDSKKLSPKKRAEFAKIIREQAASIGLGWVSAENIDKYGLAKALKIAAQLALKEITAEYDEIIIDGTIRLIDDPRVLTLKQADLLVPSVSAASIVAKVARDYYMSEVAHQEFPNYLFNKHVGYGTADHHAALKAHGISKLHRRSFAPVKAIDGIKIPTSKTNKIISTSGRQAENIAADFLRKKGFKILEQNWRTKWCEIDIVAQKNKTVYFVEVKHRKKDRYGDGLSAITKKKLSQMRFAAELWIKRHQYGGEARLSAVSTSGIKPHVVDWLDDITLG